MDAAIFSQRDMSAGQIDPSAERGDDTDIMRAGLREARNVRILNARGLKRRPGRKRLFSTTGIVEVIRPAVGERWTMALEAGSVTLRNRTMTDAVTFGGMPWSQEILDELYVEVTGGNVVIAHQSFQPRVLTYQPTSGAWTAGLFQFAVGLNGAIRQPFRNFLSGQQITMQPSGRTGSITLAFSAPVLGPAHAGVVFTYAGCQVRIDVVLSSTTATATVLQELPPTLRMTLYSTQGFQIGDVVEGIGSGAKGTVIRISGFDIDVVVTKVFTGFIATEKLVGPRSAIIIIGLAVLPPAAYLGWEEALMSPARGWPGCVCSDSQRLIFANFPQYGPGICWSAVGTLNDFLVGANTDDAIFDYVPENCQILHVVGGADEFVLTDTGAFFIPISAASPLKPGSVEFRRISNDAAGPVRPKTTAQGIAYVNPGATRVMAIVSTGQTAAPYIVDDLTQYHSRLIQAPVALAYTPSESIIPERYLYVVNSGDGSIAVARFEKRQNWVGWVPWDGVGKAVWTSAGGDQIVMTVSYDFGAGPVRYAEEVDWAALLDGAIDLATITTSEPLELSPGEPFEIAPGDTLELPGGYALAYGPGATVSVEQNGWYRGDYQILESGDLSGDIPVVGGGGLLAGFRFDVVVTPFVPHANEGPDRKQRMRKRRLKQVAAVVRGTQAVEIAGRLIPFWKADENQEIAPPERDITHRARKLGRDWDPTWSVRQELPGTLTIIELTTEVTI